MFTPSHSDPEEIRKEFASTFQACLAMRDRNLFTKLVDKNSSGYEASLLLGDQVGAKFKHPKDVDEFHGEVLSQKKETLSIFFYCEFEGEFRDAIVEFDLHKSNESYEVEFLVFKPS